MTNARPVLPGYYPDPSICRVGDTYWMVNSSFESFPALPVHRSTDLVTWEQVGHVFTRPSALPLTHGDAPSRGTFAPCIRHHDGVFYVTVTNVGAGLPDQLITSTKDPEQGWSDPVSVPDTPGIDPDLTWDDKGTCHLTWRSLKVDNGVFAGGIHHVTINPATGGRLGKETELWGGTGMRDAEGPHLYQRGQWWYLLLAEGGTGLGHCVTMARAKDLAGEWEEHPDNPVLTHRSLAHPVQATGHADLVPVGPADENHPDGDWGGQTFAMVHLGIRPREPFPAVHVNGRETFLVGVDWSGDWPVVDEEAYVEAIEARDAEHPRSFTDDLRGEPGAVAPDDDPWALADRWVSPGGLAREALSRDDEGRLVLSAFSGLAGALGDGPVLATRCRDEAWSAEVTLTAQAGVGELICYLDPAHWAAVRWDGERASAVVQIGPLQEVLGATPAMPGGTDGDGGCRLRLECRRPEVEDMLGARPVDEIVLCVAGEGDDEPVELARIDGRYLSTEVAGGFTGRHVGVRTLTGAVRVEDFAYTAL